MRALLPWYAALFCIFSSMVFGEGTTDVPLTSCVGTPTKFTDYAHMDFVIVSLRAMCSTEMSLKRIMAMYLPRRIHYITGYPSECPSLSKIINDEERFRCLDENAIFQNVSKPALKTDCLSLIRDTKKTLGWHMQQFVKLGVSRYLNDLSEKYIIFDADNLITYPFDMMDEKGKIILPYKAIAARMGYDIFYEKTLQRKAPKENYVVGHMVMEKSVVREMLDEIDKAWGSVFPKSVCDVARKHDLSNVDTHFSEYFFYAAYLKEKYPSKIAREYYWAPGRNPSVYQALAWKGDCCVKPETVCQSYKSVHDFYVIIEEHKFRYRDQVCTDDWKLDG